MSLLHTPGRVWARPDSRDVLAGTFIYKASEAPAFPTGHYTNAGFMFVGALLALGLRAFYIRKNRGLLPGEPRWRL